MTRRVTLVLQLIAGCGQVLIPAIPGITQEWMTFGHAVIGACQVAITIIAHNRNPDGTMAEDAYTKGK